MPAFNVKKVTSVTTIYRVEGDDVIDVEKAKDLVKSGAQYPVVGQSKDSTEYIAAPAAVTSSAAQPARVSPKPSVQSS